MNVLIVGASSHVGLPATRLLAERGASVRAMTRTPEKADALHAAGAEVIAGDLLDPASLARACEGVDAVLAAAHGLLGSGRYSPRTVDDQGNRSLIDCAKAAGVTNFVFISLRGAAPNARVEFMRAKYAAEQYLAASGLAYTILRPSAFMETWAEIVGTPAMHQGKATVFGDGKRPINFIAAEDVAHYAVYYLLDAPPENSLLTIGGPDNLTLDEVVAIFTSVADHPAKITHIPVPMMKLIGTLSGPFNPIAGRMMGMGVHMAAEEEPLDVAATGQMELPVVLTPLRAIAERSRVPA